MLLALRDCILVPLADCSRHVQLGAAREIGLCRDSMAQLHYTGWFGMVALAHHNWCSRNGRIGVAPS